MPFGMIVCYVHVHVLECYLTLSERKLSSSSSIDTYEFAKVVTNITTVLFSWFVEQHHCTEAERRAAWSIEERVSLSELLLIAVSLMSSLCPPRHKATSGLNRRTEMYLKEHEHIRRYGIHVRPLVL